MILGVNHVAISTGDIDRLAAFYRDVIGFKDDWAHEIRPDHLQAGQVMGLAQPQCRVVMLQLGTLGLELFEFSNPVPVKGDPDRPVVDHGITHMCLSVTDIDAEYDRLSAAGMRFHARPVAIPDGRKAIYGRDPDGNVIELLQDAA